MVRKALTVPLRVPAFSTEWRNSAITVSFLSLSLFSMFTGDASESISDYAFKSVVN
jgi:hypothetical protein